MDHLSKHVYDTLNQLENINKGEILKDAMDISLCMLDKKTKKLTFAGAGNPMFIIPANAQEEADLQEIDPDKRAIASEGETEFTYSEQEFQLQE